MKTLGLGLLAWPVKKLRLGAGVFGADVTGWSVIFGYRF